MRRVMLFFGLCVVCLFSSQTVYADRVHVHSGGHYLEWNDKPFIPVGDSVTQGWFLSGNDFNHVGYIDALAERNMNIVMLWSFTGTNPNDYRFNRGFESSVIWPWAKNNGKFNLNILNAAYFNRLKQFVAYADKKNMVVLITVFDGWIRGTFTTHPFNKDNNGPLEDRQDFVKLATPGTKMNTTLNLQTASWKQKNQYFQEKFAAKLISELKAYDNVIYEMFNEKDLYTDKNARKSHEEHFLKLFRDQLKGKYHTLLLTNEDQVNLGDGNFNAHTNNNADVVSKHGGWTKDKEMFQFPDFIGGFYRKPFKPYMFSEPVKGWSGLAWRDGKKPGLNDIRRSVWETTLSGAGWVNQNDPSWGWNEKSLMSDEWRNRDIAYDYAGHCADFINNTIDIAGFKPMKDSSSSKEITALAKEVPYAGKRINEYIVYSPKDNLSGEGDFYLDLPSSKKKYFVTWLNPRNGDFKDGGMINAGGRTIFRHPSDGGGPDWVMWLHSHRRILNPGIGLLLQ